MRYHRGCLLFLLGIVLAGSSVGAEGLRQTGVALKSSASAHQDSTASALITATDKTPIRPDVTPAISSHTLAMATPADRVQPLTASVSLPSSQPRDVTDRLSAMRGKDPELRSAAILDLCKVKEDARINEAFLKLLAAGQLDMPHRQKVIGYLVSRNVLQVSPHLVTMLKSPDSKVRIFALGQMDRLFSSQGLPEVERLVRKDPDKTVRSKAAMTAIWMRGFKK